MNYDEFEKIKKQVGAENLIKAIIYATTQPGLGIGLLVERVDRIGEQLGHFYEGGKWHPYYREIAYEMLRLLDKKFGCSERCIARLLTIDIASEIIPYLSSISPQEVEEYKEKEYYNAKEELKEFFSSSLSAYFWKWKYGFDIEKAYRWHRIKEIYTIFLNFRDIPVIDKYITPEETDILMDGKFLDLRSDELRYYLDSKDRGPNVVINMLIEKIKEKKRYYNYKKMDLLLMNLEHFEEFYKAHLRVLYHYEQLKDALSLEENPESQARIQKICEALEDLHKVLEHISINIPIDSQTITLEIPKLTDTAGAEILDKKYETVKQLLELERTYRLRKSDLIDRLKKLSSNADISPKL